MSTKRKFCVMKLRKLSIYERKFKLKENKRLVRSPRKILAESQKPQVEPGHIWGKTFQSF